MQFLNGKVPFQSKLMPITKFHLLLSLFAFISPYQKNKIKNTKHIKPMHVVALYQFCDY